MGKQTYHFVGSSMTSLRFFRMVTVLLVAGCFFSAGPVGAGFHLIQIEQVIGGVNGDTTAQAIQLRMRSADQHFIGNQSEINVYDATGSNPVKLVDFTTNVTSGAGKRILITTPNFANYTDTPLVPDFTMNPIPVPYLEAGQISFEGDLAFFGKLWNLNYGGASYTGTTAGTTWNDGDSNFGPPFSEPLPSALCCFKERLRY